MKFVSFLLLLASFLGGVDAAKLTALSPAFRADKKSRIVNLILVSDEHSQSRYGAQLKSIRCYADRHGYALHILQGTEYEDCRGMHDFFFRKHCTVAKFLEQQPPDSFAAVLDGDVVVASPSRGLDKWIDHGADVQLYNRCLFHEIMAGNYMVRNTKFARDFLIRWASYVKRRPKGFSSADNGAIHLAVMETVQVEGYKTCFDMYENLTALVTDLDPYWEYVRCTKEALGPARAWKMPKGSLTVWPRFEFFTADGFYLERKASLLAGPVMHHGIKDPADVTGHYYEDVDKCVLNNSVIVAEADLGRVVLGLAQNYVEYFPHGKTCKMCPGMCMASFSCDPLEDAEPPRPKQVQNELVYASTIMLVKRNGVQQSWGWRSWQADDSNASQV